MSRTEIARRKSLRRVQSSRATSSTRPGMSPAHRAPALPTATGRVIKSHAVKMTATQRNSEGRPSEWNRSPEFFTDPKWGSTVREVQA